MADTIKIGNYDVSCFKVGSSDCKIYLGDTLLYPKQVVSYYKVEDVTPNKASGWTITSSSTYNPDLTYYDDFDLATNSATASYKIAKVTIFGYDHFTYYLRSSAYTATYGYVVATNIDELSTNPTGISYNSISAITNTYYFSKPPKSAVNLGNYRRVTYNNLDASVEHTFYVVFYGRNYSSYKANATILIPKEQTNENWEQVSFSSSTNVRNAQKNLFIDNATSSAGTSYFYSRWIVGLPAGSHSSYVNYSNYDYCPNVTSSTFTSVAGNSRQVNFIYDGTTNKTLSFRLVDTSGNTLTPSETVYYYFTKYNSCSKTTGGEQTFPATITNMKVGGRFLFSSSSNRHYIYGYTPPTLSGIYYVNSYNSTFDIVHTALDREAVTITYTTYDPNDSETPAFKTDITWPYNGGTTSSTTLTTFDVPYTYSYSVNEASNMFSASTQTYTASTASRTIILTLYPNNREFSTVADMEAYQYVWEGMKATVGASKYRYENGEWVDISHTVYEYIKSQAKKIYDINTNFYPTTANTIEIKMEMTDTSVDWGKVICWAKCNGDSCDASQFRFTTVTSNYAIIGRKGNTSGVTYKAIGKDKPITVKLPLSSTKFTYNSGTTTDYSVDFNYNANWASNLPSSTAMHIWSLGGANVSDSASRRSACCKIFYIKIYDASNNLIKHYVPSIYNNSPCFYEEVDGEFIVDTYTGTEHGTLTLGPEVS